MNVISVTRARVSALVTDDRDTVIVSEVTLLIIGPIILSQRHVITATMHVQQDW